jgi:hypothetical protein
VTDTAHASAQAIAHLRNAATIRERCGHLWRAVLHGESRWFTIDVARLVDACDAVVDVTRRRYPDLVIPYHSRWRHFEVAGIDRTARLEAAMQDRTAHERARALVDLAFVSVLLDAGAGADWKYREAGVEAPLTRSEGLAVASFDGFVAGLFSSDPLDPWRVDARALQQLDLATLATMLQVDDHNALVGLEGRLQLLHRLGRVLVHRSDWFGVDARPAGLFDRLSDDRRVVAAAELLASLLETLSPIWLAGNQLDGVPLGDCWPHRLAGGEGQSAGRVPFHKLSQWLAYSLFEPFESAGIEIAERDALTGLPEYRNGGLFIDTGVIALRDPQLAARVWRPGDEAVIEWRALTVCGLDRLALLMRDRLDLDAQSMPLACVLEGGSWAAGRQLAAERRRGMPPLSIDSDGTVF